MISVFVEAHSRACISAIFWQALQREKTKSQNHTLKYFFETFFEKLFAWTSEAVEDRCAAACSHSRVSASFLIVFTTKLHPKPVCEASYRWNELQKVPTNCLRMTAPRQSDGYLCGIPFDFPSYNAPRTLITPGFCLPETHSCAEVPLSCTQNCPKPWFSVGRGGRISRRNHIIIISAVIFLVLDCCMLVGSRSTKSRVIRPKVRRHEPFQKSQILAVLFRHKACFRGI